MKFAITTQLKSQDAAAATALNCLIEDMGMLNSIRSLQRREVWIFDTDTGDHEQDRPAIESMAGRLALETRIFVNPNKHLFQLFVPASLLSGIECMADRLYRVKILVEETGNAVGIKTLKLLHELYGFPEITAICAGILWLADVHASSTETAVQTAETISLTKSVSKGLLANPNYQCMTIL